MAHKHDMAQLYLTQKSLSEWFEDIKHERVEELRHEDNEKRERLKELNSFFELPYDAQVQFTAQDVADNTSAHQKYVAEHANDLCALRLIPLDKSLPKLRMRGRTVAAVQDWFKEQHINPSKYRAEYIPHSDNQLWSTIFVVNEDGIFGEIIQGTHTQLTQGFYDDNHWPYTFSFDFREWHVEPENAEVLQVLQRITNYLKQDATTQAKVAKALDAEFAHGYLQGYFETTESVEFGLWFVDYAPMMGKMLGSIAAPQRQLEDVVSGQVACAGSARGPVRIVADTGADDEFPEGAVLVCSITTPDFVPLMQKASAIVTDNGGILSHAAIVARELRKPCIVGTKHATTQLKNGQVVLVDANSGKVTPVAE